MTFFINKFHIVRKALNFIRKKTFSKVFIKTFIGHFMISLKMFSKMYFKNNVSECHSFSQRKKVYFDMKKRTKRNDFNIKFYFILWQLIKIPSEYSFIFNLELFCCFFVGIVSLSFFSNFSNKNSWNNNTQQNILFSVSSGNCS